MGGEKYQNEDSEARRKAVEPLNHSRLTAGLRKRADCAYERLVARPGSATRTRCERCGRRCQHMIAMIEGAVCVARYRFVKVSGA